MSLNVAEIDIRYPQCQNAASAMGGPYGSPHCTNNKAEFLVFFHDPHPPFGQPREWEVQVCSQCLETVIGMANNATVPIQVWDVAELKEES